MEEPSKKKHRAPKSGAKAAKKSVIEKQAKAQNPKGFAIQHTTKAARKVRKTLDRETPKYHLPKISAEVPANLSPPLVVGIVGPPRSGKSTLLRSLIKHFGRQAVPVVTGPITVVVKKKSRMTFIECGCNINSMIDISKVADLVLLVVNVQRGLEMYHFEFINMLQVHGMPRVIPVLNHLDQFNDSSSSRALRKKIKQRLWTDLSAKIFLLTRFMLKKVFQRKQSEVDGRFADGEYMPAEIQRLAHLMVVKSPRLSDWRTGHPYMLVDRLEDVTNPRVIDEDQKANRMISLYGWVRGAPIEVSSNSIVHIPGLGDFPISECIRQQDPCPTLAQLMKSSSSIEEAIEVKLKKRLSEGECKIYAPMSSIGGVLFDRDATYIDLGGSHHLGGGRLTSGRQAVVGANEKELTKVRNILSSTGHGLDERLDQGHRIQMLADAPLLVPSINSPDKPSSSDDEDDNDSRGDYKVDNHGGLRIFEDIALPDTETDVKGSNEKISKSNAMFGRHRELKDAFDNLGWEEVSSRRKNWKHIIYSFETEAPESTSESLTGELFHIPDVKSTPLLQINPDDVTLPQKRPVSINWTTSAALIANRFTTGNWDASEDAEQLLAADANAQWTLKSQKMIQKADSRVQYREEEKCAMASSSCSEISEEEVEDIDTSREEEADDTNDRKENGNPTEKVEKSLLRPTKRERLLEKRRRHKELFDRLYEIAQRGSGQNSDEPVTAFYKKMVTAKETQEQLNREVLASLPPQVRDVVEGVPPGSYVRLQIVGVPYQFIANFDPRQPLVIGGLVKGEEAKAFIQARFRAHRWLRCVLKSNDPVTVSIGWRRYQTIGVFSKEDHNLRKRYLKYALAHEHCHITFYGPVVPAKTGVIAFSSSTWRDQIESSISQKFRIAGIGSVTDCNESFQIMKKLKLIGYPFKIFDKTAFVQGMFNSELEVAKMIGAKIQTVSKVRGLIKSALTGTSYKPGDFRATFEAPIRMASIVFARTFVPVQMVAFYNPINNLLVPPASTTPDGQWRMLRTVGELRWDTGTKVVVKEDSKYKEAQRVPFTQTPLTVPTKLVATLPFADKPKLNKGQLRTQRFQLDEVRRARHADIPAPIIAEDSAGIPNPVGHARDRAELIQHLRQLHAAYRDRERGKMVARTSNYKAKRAAENELTQSRNKRRRKEFFLRHRGGFKEHSGKGDSIA